MTTNVSQCLFTRFGLREDPFHVSPDPRYYHSTVGHDSARDELLFGVLSRQGLLVLTGEAGTGKTTLLNSILDILRHRNISTSYIFHSLLDPAELIEFILRDFGIAYNSQRKGDLVHLLHRWLIARSFAGDSPVLILDEAQSLSLETLDELRLLLNLETPRGKLLQVILAGQPELEEKLRSNQLRSLRQRIFFHCRLSVFSEEQSASYIQTRIAVAGLQESSEIFPEETLQLIHKHSKGIPRVINLICEHALITAYGEQQKTISPEMIQRIATDFGLTAKPSPVENEYTPGTFGPLISFLLFDPKTAGNPAEPELESVQPLAAAALHAVGGEIPNAVPRLPVGVPFAQSGEHVLALHQAPIAVGVSRPQFVTRAASSFKQYWKEVRESLVRDWRYFYSFSFQTTSHTLRSAVPKDNSNLPRNPLRPIADWLRHPIVTGQLSAPGRSSRSSSSK